MATFSELSTNTIANGITISKYSNVVHTGSDSANKNLYLDGNWFIVDANSQGYNHFMYDSIAQFYGIKTVVPGLKPLILVPNGGMENPEIPNFVWWCIDKLLLEGDAVLVDDYSTKSFTIENLYVASTEYISFFRLMDIEQSMLLSIDKYQDFVLPELRKFFLRHLEVSKTPIKVYMSRKDKSGDLLLLKEYIEYLKHNRVLWDSVDEITDKVDFSAFTDPLNVVNEQSTPSKFRRLRPWTKSPAFLELEVNARYMLEEDEDMIESFFVESGYTVISHTDLTYEEQMSIIASASHFATFTASAVLNSIVCRDGANIYILNHNTKSNRANHLDYLPTVIFENSYSVFSNRDCPGQIFSMEDIISRLKELGV